LDTLFISNSVRLATRVRADVMKVIARKVSNKDDLAYVAGFTSRPMMHIRKAGAPSPSLRPLKSFSYIDTVMRFGHLVDVRRSGDLVRESGEIFQWPAPTKFCCPQRTRPSLTSVFNGHKGPNPRHFLQTRWSQRR
jgi:hypothetical protein